ncbi:Xaa-Pro peptidase family protein [Hoyosella sp. YIM 151337]|uniref:M24 family metallopeptidase n=1 Tax=Hoyosella sp. YIM 151337 TaxID=2992742 RepID=UPI0022360E65|nr:Xaa-Pro peptidase family protein [Hoyosella sp. YIM 151337]MCW4353063.1 Xaa-Pro peptidase family protein [Hoyosella sp. YIM 151337]
MSDTSGATTFPPGAYAERIRKAQSHAAAAGLAGLLISPGPDLQYLAGSRMSSFERLTCLVIPADGDPAVVVPRLEVAALRGSPIDALGIELRPWVDGDDPYLLVRSALASEGRVAIADAMPALHAIPLARVTSERPLELATPVLRELRMIKDDAELAALRAAGAAIDRVHARMAEFVQAGRTEAQAAADITAAIIEEGHTEAAFVIVGSGPNGADPHHEVSDRLLSAGDVVVVDIGGPVAAGYYSDCTRTYALGEPDSTAAERIGILEAAQRAAVRAVRPGVTAGEIDAAARDHLRDHDLAEFFVHRTGHGIGLSVHEEPYIVSGSNQTLRAGMAFSVEPGVYLPGQWGARIEDIIVVTDHGAESLNNQPHELTVLS